MTRKNLIAAVLTLTTLLAASLALPQSISLTPEQQQLLDQLPPAQRQQALDALRNTQAGQLQTAGEPVREQADTPAAGLSPVRPAEPVGEVQRASANSRLVINFTPQGSLNETELEAVADDPALSRLQGSHTFVLNENGSLSLLGIESVPLLGLTEPQWIGAGLIAFGISGWLYFQHKQAPARD